MNVKFLRPCLRIFEKRNQILLPISHYPLINIRSLPQRESDEAYEIHLDFRVFSFGVFVKLSFFRNTIIEA